MSAAKTRRGRGGRNGGKAEARAATAYVRLHRLIGSGMLAPGSPLVESDICARLGVSRTPVRAALLRLQQEGFVRGPRAGPGGRAAVSPLTATDLREIFLMIGALEATAARHAAGMDPVSRTTMAAALDEENRAFRGAIAQRPPDLRVGMRHHLSFHLGYVRAEAGLRLCGELITLRAQASRYERVYSAATLSAIDEFVCAHEAIISALRAGDADGTERAVRADWRLAADRHAEMIEMLGERGSW